MNAPRNTVRALALLLAIGLSTYLVWPSDDAGEGPRYRWLIGDGEDPRNYLQVEPDTGVRLELTLTFPAHVYAASHNPTDGTIALFPSPWLRTDLENPLPAGTHVLPGRFEETPLAWPVRATLGATDYVAVVSPEPIAELDELLRRTRQISNTTFPDHRVVVTAPRDRSMDDVPPTGRIPGRLLPAAAAIVETGVAGPLQPWSEDQSVLLTSVKVVVTEAGPSPSGK